MVSCRHPLNGHEFEQTPGDSKGQGSLACCSQWGHRESDMSERLNNNTTTTNNSMACKEHSLGVSIDDSAARSVHRVNRQPQDG